MKYLNVINESMKKEILRLRYDIPDKTTAKIWKNIKDIPIKVSTNKIYSWMHWTIRNAIAERYHNLTTEDCNHFVTIDKKVDLKMRFYFRTHALDSSNCSFMAKMLEDSLVKNWLLQDDTNKFVWEFNIESVELSEKKRKEIKWHYVRIYIYEH